MENSIILTDAYVKLCVSQHAAPTSELFRKGSHFSQWSLKRVSKYFLLNVYYIN